jgi:hypothetical protein
MVIFLSNITTPTPPSEGGKTAFHGSYSPSRWESGLWVWGLTPPKLIFKWTIHF